MTVFCGNYEKGEDVHAINQHWVWRFLSSASQDFFPVCSVNVTMLKKSVPKFLCAYSLNWKTKYWSCWTFTCWKRSFSCLEIKVGWCERATFKFLLDFVLGFLEMWARRWPARTTQSRQGFDAQTIFFFRRGTGLCIAAPQRRSRLFSPKCLRMLRFHKWQVDTDSPWCSPARWMKEDETSAVLFSKPWTHLF